MWQKCPICDGEGRVSGNGTTSSVHQVCSVCKGAKIISGLSGLPAQSVPTVSKMETTQTAVEWLEKEIDKVWKGDIMYMEMPRDIYYKLIKQAKAMEKEQIKIAVEYGCSDWGSGKDAEQYYNYKYGK